MLAITVLWRWHRASLGIIILSENNRASATNYVVINMARRSCFLGAG
ncbi:protein of unknown function [Methylocaldum szegediense]|uniref:Uncharacterized protein n=1 Tax=Methylocaldum szegediense TaxID=73780 RepID=A0ABM9I6U5_9GAMM|nr:protein of unknown function [Methylocaldum szegediense]